MTAIFLTELCNALCLGVMLVFMPMGVGYLVFPAGERDKGIVYISGMLAVLAAFELIYLPFFFLRLSFSLLTAVFMMLMTLAAVCGYLKIYRLRPLPTAKRTPLSKGEWLSVAVFALVFVFQVLRVTAGAGTWNIDDAWYLTIANDAVYYDSIMGIDPVTGLPHDYTADISANVEYIFSPWPMFWAMFAKILSFPVTTLMRTVLPFYFISIFYYVLYRLVFFIFGGRRDRALFALCLLGVFYELSSVAMNVRYTWILCYPWMGKGFGPSVVCPAALLLFLSCRIEEDGNRRKILWLGVFLANLAGCMVASSCAELNLVALGCWGLVSFIEKRDLSMFLKLGLCVSPSLALMCMHFL